MGIARYSLYFLFLIILCPYTVSADQPIMSEVPRWNGGYGVQVFQEFRWSDDLMRGSSDLPNPNNLQYEKFITHVEGVYTWNKSIRMTAKFPYVHQERRILDGGSVRRQESEGWDDMKLALPLRRYQNRRNSSGHVGIVPQVRFGGENDDSYRISDGSTDPGLGYSFEYETAGIKLSTGGTYWWEQRSGLDDDWGVALEIGYNYHDRGSVAWRMDYIDDGSKYEWFAGGPTLFWNFNDVVLGRAEYKYPFYEKVDGVGIPRGQVLRIGLGVVF